MTTVVSPFTQAGREVLIAEAARTPMGRSHPERGWFRDTHPNTMLAACYTELLARSGLAPGDVEDLVIGCTAPFGEQSRNIGRNAWLQAGYPPEVPAVTLDRRCGSAQTAVEVAAGLIASGTHDVIIAGGVEHMGHAPIDSPSKLMELYGDPWPAELRDQYAFVGQGESAELIADRWQIGRDEMDAYAARSHQLAAAALESGRFAAEMIPMELDGHVRRSAQGIRPDTGAGEPARRSTAVPRDGGPITAGSSSPLSDGAAGVLLASRDAVERHGLHARARSVAPTPLRGAPTTLLT